MSDPEPISEAAERRPRPRDILHALGYITRLPLPAPEMTGWQFARAALFFPVIGFLEGLLLVVVSRTLLLGVDPTIAGPLLGLLWEVMSAPLANPAEQPEWRWHVTTRQGSALVLAMALKATLLTASGPLLPAALLFAPALGRWSVVVLAVGARSAADSRRKFNSAVTFQEFGIASLTAFLLVFSIGQFIGLVLIVTCGAVTLLLRLAFHRWQGGVTWETVVGGMHVVEISAVAVLAALG